jgi:hypothetical protein
MIFLVEKGIIFLNSINHLSFITENRDVFSELRTIFLYIIQTRVFKLWYAYHQGYARHYSDKKIR